MSWLTSKMMKITNLNSTNIDIADLNGFVIKLSGTITANSALGIVTNFSNLVWAFGTFAATLFSLLQLDLERIWDNYLANFSPFSSEDNVQVYSTIRTLTWQVFAGSASVGITHSLLTYFALNLVSSPLLVLPAFASCCLAVAPLFGTFVVWLPFVIGYWVADEHFQAIFIALIHLFASIVIDPWLTSKFPSSANFIGGLPIVAGLFAWGGCGIIYGPLIVGLSIVMANIYLRCVTSIYANGAVNGGRFGDFEDDCFSEFEEDDHHYQQQQVLHVDNSFMVSPGLGGLTLNNSSFISRA